MNPQNKNGYIPHTFLPQEFYRKNCRVIEKHFLLVLIHTGIAPQPGRYMSARLLGGIQTLQDAQSIANEKVGEPLSADNLRTAYVGYIFDDKNELVDQVGSWTSVNLTFFNQDNVAVPALLALAKRHGIDASEDATPQWFNVQMLQKWIRNGSRIPQTAASDEDIALCQELGITCQDDHPLAELLKAVASQLDQELTDS